MPDLPRLLFAIGLLGGYTWAAWLRFDRGARGRITPDQATPGRPQDDPVEALVAWDRAQQAAGTEQTVRRGPIAHGLGLVPVAYLWVGTLGLLLAPERLLPFVSSDIPRFVSAAASAAAVALALALSLGLYGWMRARSRYRRGAGPTLEGLP